ncbi:hypothetical protein PR003_g10296 [Phytophthora rubi]|uniref:Uncharacterized protein n=1 Tax=Phytophthora rubi TaxID=129364 RepID=A0A6A4FPS5_9STRA|nr:hypothetical protein PR003_g10296 [Phytophthora rubi]
MSCFYCAGVHGDISGGPHLKNKCEKRKHDIELKVFQRNIWSYPSTLKKARNDTEPTPKMTGKGKFKAQANGKERTVVSTDDCLPKDVSLMRATPCSERQLQVQLLRPALPTEPSSPQHRDEIWISSMRKRRMIQWDRYSTLAFNGGRVNESEADDALMPSESYTHEPFGKQDTIRKGVWGATKRE